MSPDVSEMFVVLQLFEDEIIFFDFNSQGLANWELNSNDTKTKITGLNKKEISSNDPLLVAVEEFVYFHKNVISVDALSFLFPI